MNSKPALHLLRGLLLALLAWAAQAEPAVLRVLAWPGYAEPEVVKAFERKTGARVELTIIDTDEALWARASAKAGAEFDVLSLNTAELQRYIRAGLVQALDLTRIPNTRHQLPRFQKLEAIPGLVHRAGTAVYGIPFTYSEMGLIYDRRQFAQAPDAMAALWDPSWRGKVLAYNGGTHNFSLAAQQLGAASPFRIADADWGRAIEQLIGLRRNVLGFYSQPEESVRLFMRHRVALMFANYGAQQLQLLKKAGADVGYVMPREGALAWLDCWALMRKTPVRDLAHAWIDHLIDTEAGRLLVERQGLANTLTESAALPAGAKVLWLEPVEDAPRRESLWARIRSGDRSVVLP